MIDKHDKARLIDFGLSTIEKDSNSDDYQVGSPSFLAPEAIKGKQSKEADMWALGVTLYMLVSGYAPIAAEDTNKLFDAIVEGKWDFNLRAFRKVSVECKDLITRLLCVDP